MLFHLCAYAKAYKYVCMNDGNEWRKDDDVDDRITNRDKIVWLLSFIFACWLFCCFRSARKCVRVRICTCINCTRFSTQSYRLARWKIKYRQFVVSLPDSHCINYFSIDLKLKINSIWANFERVVSFSPLWRVNSKYRSNVVRGENREIH